MKARATSEDTLDPAALPALSLEELRSLWRRIVGLPPPAHASRDLVARALVYRVSARKAGVSVKSLHTRLNQLAQKFTGDRDYSPPTVSAIQPGAVLVRDWNGKRYAVTVTHGGYLLDGENYESLSAVAHVITGTKWSGPRFFKLNSLADGSEP